MLITARRLAGKGVNLKQAFQGLSLQHSGLVGMARTRARRALDDAAEAAITPQNTAASSIPVVSPVPASAVVKATTANTQGAGRLKRGKVAAHALHTEAGAVERAVGPRASKGSNRKRARAEVAVKAEDPVHGWVPESKTEPQAEVKLEDEHIAPADDAKAKGSKAKRQRAPADGDLAVPKRRRTKQKEPIVLKTEYDVAQATTEADDEQAASNKPEKKVFYSRRPPAVIKGSTQISDELLDRLPHNARQKYVGCHVSMGGGMERAVVNAAAMGCKAFALDTRNKRSWESPPLLPEVAAAFKDACEKYNFSSKHILPHGSYLINLGSANDEIYQKSYDAFVKELKRCEMLGLELYNFHPGGTSGLCTPQESLDRIADSINRAHAETSGVTVVLENMAGGGNQIGHTFENLKCIIDKVEDKGRVGVCLDTCHLFAAGFDVSTEEGYQQTFAKFDDIVGLSFLRGLHVNDSKAALASKRDRHENIGRGMIGIDCFKWLMNDSRFDGLPLIMETPVEAQGHGPKINYPVSIRDSCVAFHETEEAAGVCTDKRDIELLYTLVK